MDHLFSKSLSAVIERENIEDGNLIQGSEDSTITCDSFENPDFVEYDD